MPSSTPAVVPGTAPALVKAGVGGHYDTRNYWILYGCKDLDLVKTSWQVRSQKFGRSASKCHQVPPAPRWETLVFAQMACAPPSPMHAATTFGRAIQPLGRARTTGRHWKWCFLIFDLGRSLQLVGFLETPVWLMVLDSFMFKWFSVVGLGGIQSGHANWGSFFGIAFFATTLKVDSTSGKNRCLGKLVFLKTRVQSHPRIMVFYTKID
jgi:hypothetical protein